MEAKHNKSLEHGLVKASGFPQAAQLKRSVQEEQEVPACPGFGYTIGQYGLLRRECHVEYLHCDHKTRR